MARPGLEPGTPRFSGTRLTASLVAKGLQISPVLAVGLRSDAVTFLRLGARLGLRGLVEVPMIGAVREPSGIVDPLAWPGKRHEHHASSVRTVFPGGNCRRRTPDDAGSARTRSVVGLATPTELRDAARGTL